MQKIFRSGRWSFLILMFLFQISSYSANKKYFVITGKIVLESGDPGAGSVEVIKAGKGTSTVDIPKTGKFKLDLEFFNEFTLIFKSPGHFNKTIIVSTDIPQEVWERDSDFPPFPIVVQLLKEFEGIDKSFTLKPSGKIYYGKAIDNFENENYISDIQFVEQIEIAKQKAIQVLKESNTISKEDAQDLVVKQKKFDQLIKEADTHYQRGEFQMAYAKYLEAKNLFPDKAYPNDRVAELQDLVKALEMTEKQKAGLDLKYQEAITKANDLFDAKKYSDALPDYKEALQYRPGDVYANGRIKEIEQFLASLDLKKKYNELIASADSKYASKDLTLAIDFYTKALAAIPNDSYSLSKIKQINDEIKQQEKQDQLEKDFNQTILAAEAYVKQKDYQNATELYQKALIFKPDNVLAKYKLAQITEIIAKQEAEAKTRAEFKQVLADAESLYKNNDWDKAKELYLKANSLIPSEPIPSKRLVEINGFLAEKAKKEAEQAARLASYQDAVKRADKNFADKEYSSALSLYKEALSYQAGDTYASGRIDEIDKIIAKLDLQKKYNELIASADSKYVAKDLAPAGELYNQALELVPNDAYCLSQIKLINEEIQLKEKLDQQEKEFSQLILSGDALVQQKKYPQAIDCYKKALTIKLGNSIAQEKLSKATELFAQQEAEIKTRNDFNQLLSDAESLFKNKELDKAKELYTKANALISSEPVPPRRLAEINDLLAEKAKKEADLAARMAAYQDAVKRGDQSFATKEYESAQSAYKDALQIQPQEKYPSDQIVLIVKLLKEQKQLHFTEILAKADAAFSSANFDEATAAYKEALQYQNSSYANKQLAEIDRKKVELKAEEVRMKKIQEQYDQLLAEADASFTNKEYQKASDKYSKALTLKSDEKYPKEQLSKLEQLLGELQKEEELSKLYAQQIKTAQLAYGKNNLKEALDAYQKASQLKPNETLPPARIAEIGKMIAQKEEAARVAALEQEKKQAAEQAILDKYNTAISAGDKAYVEKKHVLARTQYLQALEAKPNEKYPRDQISKIDDYLTRLEKDNAIARQKAQQDSLLKSAELLFGKTMADAKEHEQSKRYPQAIQTYEEAIRMKPQQRTEIQKLITAIEDKMQLLVKQASEYKKVIKHADELLAASRLTEAVDEYQNAVTIKPDEEYPKRQIKEIQAKFAVLDESYNAAIKLADDAFNTSDWITAKKGYSDALALKVGEPYPTKRLKEVDRNIAQINLELANKQAAQKAYDDAVAKAEKSFKDSQLSAARMQFEEAKSLKPDEKLPLDRIKEIDDLLEQRKKDQVAKEQQEVDDRYRQAISLADNSFREKSYAIAKLKYKQALLIKPEESYPQSQMDLIDKLLKEAAPVENYTNKIPVEDKIVPPAVVYNPEESAQATEARAKSYVTITDYDEALRKADQSFGVKDYSVARFFYTKANEIRPKEEYPIKQLELIRKLIDSGLSAADLAAYEAAVTKADASFSKEDYGIAKFFYYKALEIKSWEKYPKEQIDEILARTNSLLSEKEEKIYRDIVNKGDEAYYNKDIAVARFYYNRAITMKHDEDYPRIKLKDINKLIIQDKQDKLNLEYRNFIELADQAFKNENYSIARFNYNKALSVKPDEKYPQDQLKRIKQALDK